MKDPKITDLYFLEARSRLIDLAAFLDRAQRSGAPEDFRLKSLRAALRELASPGPDKTKKALMLLSDPTTDPVPDAGSKSAAGAWPGFKG
ncbi:MAG: hypothetical protein PHD76_12490 [Methylacidiphilales bacterium]|nr:hypothetical protein [Candidatus Methylacidiphilales bacterium]